MCGIVGYIGHQECGEFLLDGLRRLEYRGYDSAGVAIYDGQGVRRIRAEGKLASLERSFRKEPVHGTIGIAHTRWATHGGPTERNAHPHQVGNIVLVHNGIIENYAELRTELQAAGRTFESDTDTEIVAHLIDSMRSGYDSLHQTVCAVLDRVHGSYALVVMETTDPQELVVARFASPLVLGLGDGENFAASDVPAIMSHTRDVIFLDDGDTAIVKASGVTVYGADRQPVVRDVKRILWDPVSAEKQGYKHFMLKEIHEQPARIVDTLRGRILPAEQRVELDELTLDPDWIRNIDRIVILACGTSYHAGMVGRYAIEKLARVPVEVELASEFRYREPVLTERTLAIAISQSGETADTLAAVREARRLGATSIAVCNVMESTIARESGNVLYTHAGPEIGVASTKAFTTQLAALYLLGLWLGRHRGTLTREREAYLTEQLRLAPALIEETLKLEDQIREAGPSFSEGTSCLFLGRGNQFPIALEGALKLKEISYIHAEGYAAGEMKHGPIALIDAHLPVVAIAPKDGQWEKMRSNVEEVRARGGRLIVVTTEAGAFEGAELELVIPQIDELFLPLLTVVPLQMLAYSIADAKGTDIDQPRNLAKSVTVE
jgi:glucosamine--fructose-6-phosphate aminotransferase (isomerizing)